MSVQDWGNAFLAIAALGALAYPLLYTRSAWHESMVGRDTMTFAVAVVVILALSFAVRVFGLDGPPRAVISTSIYAALAVLFWRRVVVLHRMQRNPWEFSRRDEERQQRREQRRANRHELPPPTPPEE